MNAAVLVAALVVGSATGAAAEPLDPMSWERLFAADGGPALHARVRYRDGTGGEHTLELWRTARALRRDTDGKLTIVVERRPGRDDEYHVVDRQHARRYDAARTSLFRIGSFPEWAQLASLLARPHGDVRVTPMARADGHTRAGSCRWYEANAPGTAERICWSPRLRLPLVVERTEGGAWAPLLTVDEARPQAIAAAVFRLPEDAARIDVDHDLD